MESSIGRGRCGNLIFPVIFLSSSFPDPTRQTQAYIPVGRAKLPISLKLESLNAGGGVAQIRTNQLSLTKIG